jgi:formimidoylglutamate deiminase
MPHLFRADLIFLDGKFQSDRGLLVGDDGRIEAVIDTTVDRGVDHGYETTHWSGKAILPGFANAHSHTFQRLIRGRAETRSGGDDFWAWREAMYRAALSVDAEDVYHVARMAFLEMVMAGTTTVGEFHYLHRAPNGTAYPDPNLLSERVLAAADSVGLRIALLRVAYTRAGYELPPHPGQRRFYESSREYLENTAALTSALKGRSEKAWLGVAPHSIRAVPLAQLEEITGWARERGLPIHMHAAEQPAELAACRREYGATPIELLAQRGLLSEKTTLVHAIHITEAEMDSLASARSIICSCPTTERNLGDGIIEAAQAAERGIRFAFGSDSEAQIDPLEDARQLEYHLRLKKLKRIILDDIHQTSLAARLFRYATVDGAEALGFDSGVLAPGRPADFFAIDLDDPSIAGNSAPDSTDDLLPIVVFGLDRAAIRDVVVAGQPILSDGVHPLRNEIVAQYKEVHRKVWRG